MKPFIFLFTVWYERFVLRYPGTILLLIAMGLGFLGYQARDFRIDASAESLLLEDDADLRYARIVAARYEIRDYLLISFTPHGDLFSESTLSVLARLRQDLLSLPRIASVTTILDAPLLQNTDTSLKELSRRTVTLRSPGVDRQQAKAELTQSPLYRNLLVSADGLHTGIRIGFRRDDLLQEPFGRRDRLLAGLDRNPSDTALRRAYQAVTREIREHRERIRHQAHEDIAAVRAVMDTYRYAGVLHLGGVGMITDDLLTFIRKDLKWFGLGVCVLVVVTLVLIFRQIRWVVLPLACCGAAVISMMGLLGLFGWEVTVVSSNFISLQMIITLAMVIHLMVRYRELARQKPWAGQQALVLNTLMTKAIPCLYAALTTMAGFGSLLLCDILPVITFGWMMAAGILVSLVLTFLIFPAGMMMLKKKPNTGSGEPKSHPLVLARFTRKHGNAILAAVMIAGLAGLAGISRLEVENSFIRYFKKTTEIHQGMAIIDRHLGGTTPLDLIVRMGPAPSTPEASGGGADSTVETAEDPDFEAFEELDKAGETAAYWFTSDKMARVSLIHDYLSRLPDVGKVLSLGTFLEIGRQLNNDKPLTPFQLGLVYNELSPELKSWILTPYACMAENEVRFSLRIMDSSPGLRRDDLLKQIRRDLEQKLHIPADRFRLAGMMVLYNNMLQSLFQSQIKTIGVVVGALFVMFLILFKSWKLALIALFPNLLSSGAVLGIMGWLAIPLDMMTITIAAISIGIAVDNTIHYIHRFRHEFNADRDYVRTMYRCHASIGNALYYTSITVIMGFSILGLSSFLPTIYFGLFTGLAMVMALVGCLTLLPLLLIRFTPLGRGSA